MSISLPSSRDWACSKGHGSGSVIRGTALNLACYGVELLAETCLSNLG